MAQTRVLLFSKSYCGHCRATKALFERLGEAFEAVELDQLKEGADLQSALANLTGQSTVPNTFVRGEHLGGNQAVQAAHASGRLASLLAS